MKHARHALYGALFVALLFLSGCATGAMRIDVEVYKGPLAQTSDAQFASLIGYLEEAKRSLVENMNFTLATVANAEFDKLGRPEAGCSRVYFKPVSIEVFLRNNPDRSGDVKLTAQANPEPSETTCSTPTVVSDTENIGSGKSNSGAHLYFPFLRKGNWKTPSINDPITWCDKLDPEGAVDQLKFFDCTILRSVFSDSRDMLREIDKLQRRHIAEVHSQGWDISEWRTRTLLMEIVETSSEFRAKAFRWAISTVGGQSSNCVTRVALINFVMTASEFGNQLQSRSDALFKQLSLREGRDARELALSTHLQDTQPTDFVHLYDWLQASEDGCPLDWVRRHALPGFPSINVTNRVKVIDRLYGDHFWSKINTVHASGAGKVNMVFVKDGIGNWNLKNFENHPGELLDAYLNVGKQVLKAAATVAAASSGVGTGGAAITAALKYADQSIAGPSSDKSGEHVLQDIQILEAGLQASLLKQAEEATKKEEGLKDKPDEIKALRLETIDNYKKTITAFGNKIGVLNKTLQPAPDSKDAEETVRKILKEQGTLVE